LDNYDNVVKFIKEAGDGLGISLRKISLSTCGLIPGIERLADENLPVTLSVSLHSPYDGERKEMMPVNIKYPIDQLMDACRKYVEKTGRRITFEYAMISGVNDTKTHAEDLVRLVKGMLCHVNLIPVNKIETSRYERSRDENIRKFEKILSLSGISVTVRRELGPDIEAACGQLRRTKV
jgi:23S rRNA (adenine2503-C2)-methyltransferase